MKTNNLLIITATVCSLVGYGSYAQSEKEHKELSNNTATQAELRWDQAEYENFKEKHHAWWKESNKNTLNKQINDLIDDINNNPSDEDDRTENLFIFNFMRELLGQPTAQSIGPKEKEWLLNTWYGYWKKEKQDDWKEENKTLPEQINDLVWDVNYHLSNEVSYKDPQRKSLFAFNFIRELLNQPTVQFIDQKEKNWLNNIAYEYWKKEKQDDWKEEKDDTFPKQINDLVWDVNYHLYDEHSENGALINETIFAFNYLRELLHQPSVQSIGQQEKDWLDNVAHEYWKKEEQDVWGKDQTTLSEHINNIIQLTGSYLFNQSTQKNNTQQIISTYNYLRKLLNEMPVQSIGQKEKDWFNNIAYEYFKKEKQTEWKEDKEDTLPKQIKDLIWDVNFYLSNENHQKSPLNETMFAFNYLRELLNQPLVQSIGQKEKEWLDSITYEYWKNHKQDEWKKDNKQDLPKKIDDLISWMNYYLSNKEPQQQYQQKEILNTYNYLRELLKQPIAKAFDQIDNQWLQQLQQKQERSVVS